MTAAQRMRLPAICTVDGCDTPPVARGMCNLHYRRWHKHGTTDLVLTPSRRRELKTHCKNGHPLSEENVWLRRRSDGSVRQRMCRACTRASVARVRARQRAGVA